MNDENTRQLDDPDIKLEDEKYNLGNLNISNIQSPVTIDVTKFPLSDIKIVPFRKIRLRLVDGSFKGNVETAELLREIGGSEAVHRMTELFYSKTFQDHHIAKFIRSQSDPHAARLGNWIVEKMGGEGDVWTKERLERSKCPVHVMLSNGTTDHVVHDRTSAHVAAWFSTHRPEEEMGRRFKLHEARVWMRLMFWSAREAGIFAISPTFEDWYPQFIAHFMTVYERSAPPYAAESLKWSSKEENINSYLEAGRKMMDIESY